MSKGNFPNATQRQRRNSIHFSNPSLFLFLTCWAIERGWNISHEILSCALFPSQNEPGWTHGTEVGTFKECHPGGPDSIQSPWTGNSFNHSAFIQIYQSSGVVLMPAQSDKRKYSHHSHWICWTFMPFISSNLTLLSAQVSLEIFQVILVDLQIPKDSGLQWILGKSPDDLQILDTSDVIRNHP